MKKNNIFVVFAMLLALVLATSCTRVPAGYTGLKINMLGDSKGGITELPAGKYGVAPNIEYQLFPNFVQTYGWTEGSNPELGSADDEAIRFQTSEGMQFTSDIGISFNISKEPGVAKNLYTSYRRGVDELIDSVLRQAVYKSFMTHGSEYAADSIIGDGKNTLIKSVQDDVTALFAPQGIEIISVSWLSSPRPPQEMINALNEKVKATQLAVQKENELRTAEAEAAKTVAKAKGDADAILVAATAQAEANKKLSASLTPQLIEMERIKAWNGVYPQVVGGNSITDLRIK